MLKLDILDINEVRSTDEHDFQPSLQDNIVKKEKKEQHV